MRNVPTLSKAEWEKVVVAMQFYVDCETTNLSSANVGDKEWDKLVEVNSILKDIELFILPNAIQ